MAEPEQTTTEGIGDSANVSLGMPGASGAIHWAEHGTPLPTNASDKLDPKVWHHAGYVSEDGITQSTDSDSTEVKDMGGTTVLKVISSYAESFQFQLLETRTAALALRYGKDNVADETEASPLTIRHTMPSGEHLTLVFDLLQTGGKLRRIVVPDGTASEFGDTQYHSGDAIIYDVTVSALPDPRINGATSVEYVGAPKAKLSNQAD